MNQLEFYHAKLEFETDSWDLSEALNNGKDIVVIDARSPEAYALEHIPTAINIPHRTVSEATTADLDKSKLYVTGLTHSPLIRGTGGLNSPVFQSFWTF
ncbi:hypothetical protein C6501_17155 [Candidatus Poribacteria bacterium]|nr:MAG: hypothetical protein C6501_17155 [Candidatus Poribacteria bacterium]